MSWIVQLFQESHGVAHTVLVLSLVGAVGLSLGTLRLFRISLGVAGVLFSGLLLGHIAQNTRFKFELDPNVIGFIREFGLILFVYTIGMQVGPSFIASLRRNGMPLNLMAAAIVLLGVAVTLGIYFTFMDHSELPAAVGLFAGATTNTPSLAAARQALKDLPGVTESTKILPGLGYAVAYPFGILGIILTMLIIRWVFRINTSREAELLAQLQSSTAEKIAILSLEVTNPNLDGLTLSRIPTFSDSGVIITRILKGGRPQMARADTVVALGDVLLAVGPRPKLEELKVVIGKESDIDLMQVPSDIESRRILVTKSQALGKSIHELNLGHRYGVRITRINRAEIELPPTPDLRLQFGDNLVAVGEADGIKAVAAELGDSLKRLNMPQVIPVFIGIALGVLVGSWPLHVGLPAPVKLGLAGGPLIVAIILSRLGNIGPLVWYMPISANFILRELGIVLFLSCVGLEAGGQFVDTVVHGQGLHWFVYGAAITVIPLLIVALLARGLYKLNFLSLCGLLAGSMTDPPALAFATSMTGSDAPSVAYATVYPLVMLLRVLAGQAMVMFLFR
jgi:putative transport protein